MPEEMNYDDVARIWDREVQSEELVDLDDLTVGRMAQYLAKVRLALTEVPAEDVVQEDIYRQEIENLEFMIRDLLTLRRDKILRAVLSGTTVDAGMTLAEEEFYGRIKRGLQHHAEFIEGILSGNGPTSGGTDTTEADEEDEAGYVLVRFEQDVEIPFVGIDERVYGPFRREDVATIPAINAQAWLRNGTVIRIVPEQKEDEKK